jgi:hypothetical protein
MSAIAAAVMIAAGSMPARAQSLNEAISSRVKANGDQDRLLVDAK